MNCRLCDKNITGKNGLLLLFDHDEEVETRLGRKLNVILNSSENIESLSNYCCRSCSSKVKICFSLLLEIKAADEVLRQTYCNPAGRKDVDTSKQIFSCQECGVDIIGIKSVIKHHENHILEKTISGTKKDVVLSNIIPIKKKKKRFTKVGLVTADHKIVHSNEELSENYNDSNYGEPEGSTASYKDEYEELVEESENKLNDETEIFESIKNVKDIDSYESFSDEASDFEDVDDEDMENEIHSNQSDLSDNESDESDKSLKSDSSYENLVELAKLELEKSDEEEDLDESSVKLMPNESGRYFCEPCNITFDYKFIFLLHLQKNHSAFHEFDVQLYGNKFETFESDNQLFIKCSHCNYAFPSANFKAHFLECRDGNLFGDVILCQVCGEMCNIENLEKHLVEHKKLDGWHCDLCGKKFKAKRFLQSHLGEHDESMKKICEICGKKLLPLSFFSHVTKHREKRHVCQYCGKAFTYYYRLKIHLKVHETGKKAETKPEKKKDKVFCWLCKKDFSCTIALNKHLKNDHNAEGVQQDSRFPCSQCDKRFADMFSLKAHLKLIHELKDEEIARLKSLPVYRYIECNICKKVCNSENKIRIHMKQDHGMKPFEMEILKKECEKCGKKFASKQNLIHHINGAHLHIKPMTCDICQEKFAKHSSLIYHKLRHSGEKPFQCEFCQKSYRQRNDVIRHLARHVRDKELTLEEASAVNNSPSRLVIKRRIFLKDSSINYRSIVRKNRRKSEAIEMEPILEEEVNEIQEEQMEFQEDGISDMIYVEEIPMEVNQLDDTKEIHCMSAKPVYNEERNTIILSNPDNALNSIKCKYISSPLKHLPAVIVKKQEHV